MLKKFNDRIEIYHFEHITSQNPSHQNILVCADGVITNPWTIESNESSRVITNIWIMKKEWSEWAAWELISSSLYEEIIQIIDELVKRWPYTRKQHRIFAFISSLVANSKNSDRH